MLVTLITPIVVPTSDMVTTMLNDVPEQGANVIDYDVLDNQTIVIQGWLREAVLSNVDRERITHLMTLAKVDTIRWIRSDGCIIIGTLHNGYDEQEGETAVVETATNVTLANPVDREHLARLLKAVRTELPAATICTFMQSDNPRMVNWQVTVPAVMVIGEAVYWFNELESTPFVLTMSHATFANDDDARRLFAIVQDLNDQPSASIGDMALTK